MNTEFQGVVRLGWILVIGSSLQVGGFFLRASQRSVMDGSSFPIAGCLGILLGLALVVGSFGLRLGTVWGKRVLVSACLVGLAVIPIVIFMSLWRALPSLWTATDAGNRLDVAGLWAIAALLVIAVGSTAWWWLFSAVQKVRKIEEHPHQQEQ